MKPYLQERRARSGPNAEWRAERDWYVHRLVRDAITAGLTHAWACELAGAEFKISAKRVAAIDTAARRTNRIDTFVEKWGRGPGAASADWFRPDPGSAIAILQRQVLETHDRMWAKRARAMLERVTWPGNGGAKVT